MAKRKLSVTICLLLTLAGAAFANTGADGEVITQAPSSPTIDAPASDAPAPDALTPNAPAPDAPATDAPATDATTTDATTTNAPVTDEIATKATTTNPPTPRFRVTLDGDYQSIVSTLPAFDDAFRAQLAKALGIDPAQIIDIVVREGSIIVEFTINNKTAADIASKLLPGLVRENKLIITHQDVPLIANGVEGGDISDPVTPKTTAVYPMGLGRTDVIVIGVAAVICLVLIILAVIVCCRERKRRRGQKSLHNDTEGRYRNIGLSDFSTIPRPHVKYDAERNGREEYIEISELPKGETDRRKLVKASNGLSGVDNPVYDKVTPARPSF